MTQKRFLSMILAIILLVSFSATGTVSAEDISYNKNYLTVRATGQFSMEIPGNTAVQADSSFPLEVGEVVIIKATYSPSSASVDFGVIAPDGLFYGSNTTTGVFNKGIQVNQRGNYTFAVRNNSNDTISVSGYINY